MAADRAGHHRQHHRRYRPDGQDVQNRVSGEKPFCTERYGEEAQRHEKIGGVEDEEQFFREDRVAAPARQADAMEQKRDQGGKRRQAALRQDRPASECRGTNCDRDIVEAAERCRKPCWFNQLRVKLGMIRPPMIEISTT